MRFPENMQRAAFQYCRWENGEKGYDKEPPEPVRDAFEDWLPVCEAAIEGQEGKFNGPKAASTLESCLFLWSEGVKV